MTATIKVTLPKLHEGQRQVWNDPARFQVIAAGRRWGKSRLASLRCITVALDGGRAWWVFPSYPMASVGWRMLKRLAVQLPHAKVREVERMIELGRGSVQIRSADNPDSLRGESLDYLVMDECAFMAEAAWTEALRPTLSDRQGKALFISTPKGRNWFWRVWATADGATWRAWQFPTVSNPHMQASEVEAARQQLPERIFQQEYLAEFIEDGAGVFRRVTDAATATPIDVAEPEHDYVIGVDWGKSNDFTAFAVLDMGWVNPYSNSAYSGAPRTVPIPVIPSLVKLERFNQIDYALQTNRLKALCERFHPSAIIAERNSMGEPLIEQLLRDGLPVQPFTTTNASKTQAIEALALAFERGDVRILPDPVLIGELQAYEMERLPSGLLRYGAPDGMHDDTVMALALAWQGIGQAVSYGANIWE